MNNIRSKGMILMWVIVVLGLVGTALMILTEGANTLLYQANVAHGRAVERNLTASALAWAQVQAAREAAPEIGQAVTLDSTAIGDERTALTVEFSRLDDASADVLIQTSYARGRLQLKQSQEYAISRP